MPLFLALDRESRTRWSGAFSPFPKTPPKRPEWLPAHGPPGNPGILRPVRVIMARTCPPGREQEEA